MALQQRLGLQILFDVLTNTQLQSNLNKTLIGVHVNNNAIIYYLHNLCENYCNTEYIINIS